MSSAAHTVSLGLPQGSKIIAFLPHSGTFSSLYWEKHWISLTPLSVLWPLGQNGLHLDCFECWHCCLKLFFIFIFFWSSRSQHGAVEDLLCQGWSTEQLNTSHWDTAGFPLFLQRTVKIQLNKKRKKVTIFLSLSPSRQKFGISRTPFSDNKDYESRNSSLGDLAYLMFLSSS